MTDQPNLQDMLDKFDPFNISHNDFVRMKPEARDAIYAAVKHDVLGQQITDNQAIALKRWCYGEDKKI